MELVCRVAGLAAKEERLVVAPEVVYQCEVRRVAVGVHLWTLDDAREREIVLG